MPDVLVEERTCGACGAEVRPDTQYCYNCGESLDSIGRRVVEGEPAAQSENMSADAKPALIPNIRYKDSSPGSPDESVAERNRVLDARPLQSAASLRRKAKTTERKPVEIVWEPAEGGTNIVLLTATVILVLFTALVVGLALYYR